MTILNLAWRVIGGGGLIVLVLWFLASRGLLDDQSGSGGPTPSSYQQGVAG